MKIWALDLTPQDLQSRSQHSMSDYLGIEFTEIGDNYVCATMPVDARTRQPLGIMHGGASCVLAETLGSTAANFCVNPQTHYCVGLDINTSHIKSAREGLVTARAEPIHIGRTTQVWRIDIRNEARQLVSTTRLTMAVLSRSRVGSEQG